MRTNIIYKFQKRITNTLIALLMTGCLIGGCAMSNVERIGMVIGIKPEAVEIYKALHADSEPGVRDLLQQANIHNFSIFIHTLDDGQPYLFGYFEYTGSDYDADMERLAQDPRNEQWLEICDPLQKPLENQTTWSIMEQVYHNK